MLSWTLWRALRRAPQPMPLYRRAYLQQQAPEHPISVHIPMFWLVKNLALILLPIVVILMGAPILAILYTLSLSLTPLLLPLANTLFGLFHASSSSGIIARERDRQTYDVLCASPAGALGLHWSYCAGWLHAHAGYRYLLLALLAIGLFGSLVGLTNGLLFPADDAPLVAIVARGLAMAALFLLDYAQTIVISSLTALLVPAYAENESSARLWASSLFLTLQVSVYLPTLLISNLLPNTLALIGLDTPLIAIFVPLLSVAFFAALREMIITGLWHRVEQALSTTAVELDAVSHAAV